MAWKVAAATTLLSLCVLTSNIGVRASRSPPAITTIRTREGDVFDCVDIYKQPAFDHPALKNHKILMKPDGIFGDIDGQGSKANGMMQYLKLDDGGCPYGTVPILRSERSNNISHPISAYNAPEDNRASLRRMWAIKVTRKVDSYLGAHAAINVYGVHPVLNNQMTASLIWVIKRDVPLEHQSTIRAGWMVDTYREDHQTRLHIEWSANGEKTVCRDLGCPGFVLVAKDNPLGRTIWPLSGYHGKQYHLPTYLFKDNSNNWWFSLHEINNTVGYWPAEIFSDFTHGREVHFGGFVSCLPWEQCPPMGNGHLPSYRDPKGACYFSSISILVDGIDEWFRPERNRMYNYANSPSCYNVGPYSDVECRFTFGGPVCPL